MTAQATRSALLLMDLQVNTVQALGSPEMITAAAAAAAAARAAGLPVIFVVVQFRPGYPELPAGNKAFSAARENNLFIEGEADTRLHPSLEVQPDDIVITKRRVSAFSGSDLAMVLATNGVEQLILGGIATQGVVLSTVRDAADRDFAITVLGDLCMDWDPDVHRILLEKVLPFQCEVTTSAAWIEALSARNDQIDADGALA